jgi:hypothetical protein
MATRASCKKYAGLLGGTLILAVVLGILAPAAQAGLVIDLRLGSTSSVLTPAMLDTNVSIEVWAKVIGAVGNPGVESIAFCGYSVRSLETDGGAVTGSLSGLTWIAPFDAAVNKQVGLAQNLNTVADNVVDRGNASSGLNVIKFGGPAMTYVAGGGSTGQAITDGWEWNVMTVGLYFDAALLAGQTSGGSTTIEVRPATYGAPNPVSNYKIDGETTVRGASSGLPTKGTSVTFTLEQTVALANAAGGAYAVGPVMNALLAGSGSIDKGFGAIVGKWWDLDGRADTGVGGFETLQTGDSLEVTYADLVALGYLENQTKNIKFQVRTSDGKTAESIAPMTMTLLPEPATMALMGLGLAAVVARRRARR